MSEQRIAFKQIMRRARELGMGWHTDGFLALPFKYGIVAQAVIAGVVDLQTACDVNEPSLHRGCLQLDGRWGWQIKQVSPFLEAA